MEPPRRRVPWRCPVCTAPNGPAAMQCRKCQKERPGSDHAHVRVAVAPPAPAVLQHRPLLDMSNTSATGDHLATKTYKELQSIAKTLGVRANLTRAKMEHAIQEAQGRCGAAAVPAQARQARPKKARAQRRARSGWKQPTAGMRLRAALARGERDISDIPPAFRPVLSGLFQRTKDPKPDDWLDSHKEDGQSFASFTSRTRLRPNKYVHTIELIPVGPFGDNAPSLESLRRFTAAFFCTPCRIGEPLTLASVNEEARRGSSGQLQVTTGAIMRRLLSQRPARDVLCRMAVTMCDLYCIKDGEPWNYVFGQAQLFAGVGAFSFARYLRQCGISRAFPIKWRSPTHDYDSGGVCGSSDGSGGTPSAEQRKELLRLSCKVLAHETTHMFGVKHCIYFDCIMCGSNNEKEQAAQPVFLCPIELRKLQHCLGFNVRRRYEGLRALASQFGWDDQVAWYDQRLEELDRVQGQQVSATSKSASQQDMPVLGLRGSAGERCTVALGGLSENTAGK